MTTDQPTPHCPMGHDVPAGSAYCPTCGAAIAVRVSQSTTWYREIPSSSREPNADTSTLVVSSGLPSNAPIQPQTAHSADLTAHSVNPGVPMSDQVELERRLSGAPRWMIMAGSGIAVLSPFLVMLVKKLFVLEGWQSWPLEMGISDASPFLLGPIDDLGPFLLIITAVGMAKFVCAVIPGMTAMRRDPTTPGLAVGAAAILILLETLDVLNNDTMRTLGMEDWVRLAVDCLVIVLLLSGGIAGLRRRTQRSSREVALFTSYGAPLGVAPGGSTVVTSPDTDGMGTASFVLSLLGLLLLGPLAIVGIVLGHISRGRTRALYGRPDGMATAGAVIGWIAVLLWTALAVVLVILQASVT